MPGPKPEKERDRQRHRQTLKHSQKDQECEKREEINKTMATKFGKGPVRKEKQKIIQCCQKSRKKPKRGKTRMRHLKYICKWR